MPWYVIMSVYDDHLGETRISLTVPITYDIVNFTFNLLKHTSFSPLSPVGLQRFNKELLGFKSMFIGTHIKMYSIDKS